MKFTDIDGTEVKEGDRIVILHDYNYQYRNGVEATVIWNPKYGRYEWTYTEVRRKKTFTNTDDFCGVHSFRKLVTTK